MKKQICFILLFLFLCSGCVTVNYTVSEENAVDIDSECSETGAGEIDEAKEINETELMQEELCDETEDESDSAVGIVTIVDPVYEPEVIYIEKLPEGYENKDTSWKLGLKTFEPDVEICAFFTEDVIVELINACQVMTGMRLDAGTVVAISKPFYIYNMDAEENLTEEKFYVDDVVCFALLTEEQPIGMIIYDASIESYSVTDKIVRDFGEEICDNANRIWYRKQPSEGYDICTSSYLFISQEEMVHEDGSNIMLTFEVKETE